MCEDFKVTAGVSTKDQIMATLRSLRLRAYKMKEGLREAVPERNTTSTQVGKSPCGSGLGVKASLVSGSRV